jgi:hypothetical protein
MPYCESYGRTVVLHGLVKYKGSMIEQSPDVRLWDFATSSIAQQASNFANDFIKGNSDVAADQLNDMSAVLFSRDDGSNDKGTDYVKIWHNIRKMAAADDDVLYHDAQALILEFNLRAVMLIKTGLWFEFALAHPRAQPC